MSQDTAGWRWYECMTNKPVDGGLTVSMVALFLVVRRFNSHLTTLDSHLQEILEGYENFNHHHRCIGYRLVCSYGGAWDFLVLECRKARSCHFSSDRCNSGILWAHPRRSLSSMVGGSDRHDPPGFIRWVLVVSLSSG